MTRRVPHLLVCLCLAQLSLLASGCNVIGVAAQLLPAEVKPAAYKGLQDQQVAVMVWSETPIKLDFESIELDLAAATQNKLVASQREKVKELKGANFPYEPRSVVRFQRDHPEIQTMSVAQFAPRLSGVTRLIYFELQEFGTRSNAAPDLYRGNAMGNLKVVEIANGKATVAFEESGITVVFPDRAPPEGLPGGSDALVYRGTIDRLSREIVHRFIPHEVER